jgi:hypothetical protein
VDPALRVCPLLTRNQQVTLALGFLDLVAQLAQCVLQFLGLGCVRPPLVLQRSGVRPVLLATQQPCRRSLRSSAIATATSCFACASCDRMSSMIWFNIFSGFSARAMRSFRFDRTIVDNLLQMLMSSLLSLWSSVAC